MKIIKAGYEILSSINGIEILKFIEKIAKTCYKSEDKITEDSATNFIKMLISKGHEAMIEHYSISVKFICDRGVSHEIVRHRIASYAQESTRYCNYSNDKFGKEITIILPNWFDWTIVNQDTEISDSTFCQYRNWYESIKKAETSYFAMLTNGSTPQEARSVLPNSLKTEIVMTTNLREWRHFFKLRTAKVAHPQMREVAIPLLREFQKLIPVVFDDIEVAE